MKEKIKTALRYFLVCIVLVAYLGSMITVLLAGVATGSVILIILAIAMLGGLAWFVEGL